MNRKRSHWLAIGLLATTGMASIVLAALTLAGFSADAAGDLNASGSLSQAGNLLVVILGSLLLIGLEAGHSRMRRAIRRNVAATA